MVVPKPLRDELGFAPGSGLEARAVEGRLEVVVPSRVSVADGPDGLILVAEGEARMSVEEVREVLERGRR